MRGRPETIGRVFRERGVAWAAGLLGAAVVAVDLFLARSHAYDFARFVPAGLAAAALLALARGDGETLGLQLAPAKGWAWWGRATAILALVLGVVLAVLTGCLWLAGVDVLAEPMFERTAEAGPWLVHACVAAPLLEELVYRLALVAPAAALLGRRPAIVLSGLAFGALHFVYGNPSPDNQLAGFVLGWAYLASGTLAVPILLHALGNLAVALVHLAWLWSGVGGP